MHVHSQARCYKESKPVIPENSILPASTLEIEFHVVNTFENSDEVGSILVCKAAASTLVNPAFFRRKGR
ncbi:hypothetical protein Q1695_000966 [Nippostrongylus brasiliensis]|nr:hypothetical protein Q1695_000966 [Nippostrongylus brasiliensis]